VVAISLGLGLGLTPSKGGGARRFLSTLSPTVLASWWQPSDADSVDVVGDEISQIYDKSGNARHLVQAAAFAQPAKVANGAQYLPAQNNVMATAANYPIVGAEERHVFVLVDRQTLLAGTAIYWGVQFNGQAFGVGLNGSGSDAMAYVWGSGDLTFGTRDLGPRLIYAGNNGATSFGSENGALTPASGAAVANTGAAPLYLGALIGGINVYTQALFREVAIIRGAMTTLLRQQIEADILWNAGLQALLPSGHPYAGARP
jgi:hypothetical protein